MYNGIETTFGHLCTFFVLVGPCAFMTSLTFKLLMKSTIDEESITNAI